MEMMNFDPDEMPTPAKVAEQLGAQAATMQEAHLSLAAPLDRASIPRKLLYALCALAWHLRRGNPGNKALQTRHWEQISGVIGFALASWIKFISL